MSTAKWHSLPILVEHWYSQEHPPHCPLLGHRLQLTRKAQLLLPEPKVGSRVAMNLAPAPALSGMDGDVVVGELPTNQPWLSVTRHWMMDSLGTGPRKDFPKYSRGCTWHRLPALRIRPVAWKREEEVLLPCLRLSVWSCPPDPASPMDGHYSPLPSHRSRAVLSAPECSLSEGCQAGLTHIPGVQCVQS